MRRAAGTRTALTYAAWLVQPAYLVVEVALAVLAGVRYSMTDDTISALGTSCAPAASGCSSAPLLMNVAFVAFGLLQALGAVPLTRGRGRTAVVGWLWAVAGLASVGVGLLPVGTHPMAHSVVALPVVPQPAATNAAAVVAHVSPESPHDVLAPPSTLAGDAPAADGDALAVEV